MNIRSSYNIMGILNITNDSFSDGGKYINNIKKTIFYINYMIKYGANIIDIGGESSKPNHIIISEKEEEKRIIPLIKYINNFHNIIISVDTYKPYIVKKSIENGVDIINYCHFYDNNDIYKIIAKYKKKIIIVHNKKYFLYNKNTISSIKNFFLKKIEKALHFGIKKKNIFLDPGFGLGKNMKQNIEIIKNIKNIVDIGHITVIGFSRKQTLSNIINNKINSSYKYFNKNKINNLDLIPSNISLTVLGYLHGIKIFRVHDVKENYYALKTINKFVNSTKK